MWPQIVAFTNAMHIAVATIDRYHDCISISPEKCSVQCQLVLLPSNVSFWGLETDNACR
jgi:hypothetical protein